MNTSRILIVVAGAALAYACASPAATSAPPTTSVTSDHPAAHCRFTFTDTEGCRPNDVETLIAPVRGRIEHCRGASGGKVRVRVRDVAGRLSFDIEPGTTLDPTERRCVLDALSTLSQDESATAWAGPNVRPSGFTSLITIEW